LILGVAFRRAGAILALGVALGVFIGGTVTAVALAIVVRPPVVAAPLATIPDVVPTAAAVATLPPVRPVIPAVPPGAVAALSGAVVLNGRISVDAAALQAALSSRGATIDIARALRALAADALLGTDQAGRIAPWAEAKDVTARLDAFYEAMSTTALDGLQASLTNNAAYRAAGAKMLTVLGSLGEVDGALRAQAATIDLELPPVAVPGASSAP
jgi:hypothetical protein